MSSPLTVALPKGRVLRAVAPVLSRAGVDIGDLLADDRTLMRESLAAGLRFLLLKPDDVPTYVEYGAADLGVCGRDVLMERTADLYQPLDLQVGVCRMVVAGPKGRAVPAGVPRVATKYPRIAARHLEETGRQSEIVEVKGSVELAPLTGMVEAIVDLTATGTTLRENNLIVREEIVVCTARLIANPVSHKLKAAAIDDLLARLRGMPAIAGA